MSFSSVFSKFHFSQVQKIQDGRPKSPDGGFVVSSEVIAKVTNYKRYNVD